MLSVISDYTTYVPEHAKKAQTSTVPLLPIALHGVTNINFR